MQILDKVISLLNLEYGEVFSCRGSNHYGHKYNGNEENFVFVEFALLKAMWPTDMSRAVATGDTRYLPISESDFHAIVIGKMAVVKTSPDKRRYLYKYVLAKKRNTNIDSVTQSSLF